MDVRNYIKAALAVEMQAQVSKSLGISMNSGIKSFLLPPQYIRSAS